MLLWRPNLSHKKKFQAQLGVVVSLVHLVLVGVLFIFQEQEEILQVKVTHTYDGVPVIVLPFQKTVKQQSVQTAARMAPSQSVKSLPKKKEVTLAKPAKKKASPQKKAPAKKEQPKKEAPKKKASEKKSEQKPQAKPEQKKNTPPDTQKIDTQKVVDTSSTSASKEVAQESAQPLYVGRHDQQMLELQAYLQQEIAEHWEPPAGLSPDLVCELLVRVNKKGVVEEIITQESSHVLVYDMAARDAAEKVCYPKEQWGKEVVLTFNQG